MNPKIICIICLTIDTYNIIQSDWMLGSPFFSYHATIISKRWVLIVVNIYWGQGRRVSHRYAIQCATASNCIPNIINSRGFFSFQVSTPFGTTQQLCMAPYLVDYARPGAFVTTTLDSRMSDHLLSNRRKNWRNRQRRRIHWPAADDVTGTVAASFAYIIISYYINYLS